MDKKKKFKCMMMIWLILFVIALVRKTLQNDTFYTIKIGELILKNGIDMLDHFSFHTGLTYTYPHWLYDVFIYLIYHLFGYPGIYISSIILFYILLLLVFKINIKNTDNYSISALGVFLCALAISSFVTARAQLVSFILFACEIYFIECFLTNGHKRYLVGLLLISLILCNIHVAVWPFYYILYLPYLVEYLVSFICKKIKLKKENKFIKFLKSKVMLEENKNIKYLFITMILSLLTGLITPIGYTPYTYFIKTAMGNSQKYIIEHQALGWKNSPFTIIIAFETFFFAFFNKAKLRDLFMISGLVLMTIVSIRHMALLALIGTICFTRIFAIFLEEFLPKANDKVISFFNKKIVIIISFALVIIFMVIMFNINHRKEYIDQELYPVDAVNYIKENIDIDKMRLFNEYNFGSYLLLNDIPVFIDSRADLYTREFSGFDYDVFDDFQHMNLNYQEKFEFYKITHALVYKKDDPMYNLLSIDNNYKMIYDDQYFALFEKLGTPMVITTYSDNQNFILKY